MLWGSPAACVPHAAAQATRPMSPEPRIAFSKRHRVPAVLGRVMQHDHSFRAAPASRANMPCANARSILRAVLVAFVRKRIAVSTDDHGAGQRLCAGRGP